MTELKKSQAFPTAAICGVPLLLLALAGCAQQPQQQQPDGVWRESNTREYFPQGRYGTASPRVVDNGRAVPRGGGRYLVGKPYTIAGKRYFPREFSAGMSQTGKASWYGDAFHGRKTANGEIYDMMAISAAHPTMPLPSYARVTNQANGRSIVVRVNDRGPYHGGRVIDLSKRVADALDFRRSGTAVVKVDYLRPAGVAGSDDRMLMATLRTDGSPANLEGSGRTLLAALSPAPAAPARAPQRAPELAAAQLSQRAAGERSQQTVALEPDEDTLPRARSQNGQGGSAPVPPSRPLDLSTIPGAAVPIAAPRRQQSVPASVTFFAPFDPRPIGPTRLRDRGPFERFDAPAGLGAGSEK